MPVEAQTKSNTMPFIYLQNHFYSSVPCNKENGTSAIDTAPLTGLAQNYINLVACPAPFCENTPVKSGQ